MKFSMIKLFFNLKILRSVRQSDITTIDIRYSYAILPGRSLFKGYRLTYSNREINDF